MPTGVKATEADFEREGENFPSLHDAMTKARTAAVDGKEPWVRSSAGQAYNPFDVSNFRISDGPSGRPPRVRRSTMGD
jgi:hypothetical protein